MKLKMIVAGLVIVAIAAPVAAQSVPDDVRCLLLSNLFAKADKDEKKRQAAAVTGMFYLGRIDGRAGTKAITDAMRSQSALINAKTAGPLMNVCAARVGRAEQSLQAIAKSLRPAQPAK